LKCGKAPWGEAKHIFAKLVSLKERLKKKEIELDRDRDQKKEFLFFSSFVPIVAFSSPEVHSGTSTANILRP